MATQDIFIDNRNNLMSSDCLNIKSQCHIYLQSLIIEGTTQAHIGFRFLKYGRTINFHSSPDTILQ